MNKIIFIDRDGVINYDPGDYITRWEDFRFEEGALEALSNLHEAGYKIIVISNQAGIGDGKYAESALWDIDKKMKAALSEAGVDILGAYYCLHGKEAGCSCRKPETGLFEKAVLENRLQFEPSETFFIGDKHSDMTAGKRFGLKTAFVRTGHGKHDEAKLTSANEPDIRADNFLEAVKKILRN